MGILLRAGVAADARGHFPYTPLQAAAHMGNHRAIEALLPGKPQLDAGDQFGTWDKLRWLLILSEYSIS